MSDLIGRLRATNKRVRHSQELREEAADSLEQAQIEIKASMKVRQSLVRRIGMLELRIEQLEKRNKLEE